MKRGVELFLGVILIILFGIAGYVVSSREFKSNFVPQVGAQSCPAPAQATGVNITYPSCVGSQCSFAQASCSWAAVSGATKYQLTVTEVETGTVVISEQDDASVLNKVFSVNQNKTYKCDVAAINSCGASGTAGTFSLLCQVDAAVTVAPTSPPVATAVPPKPTAVPTVPPTGSSTGLISIVLGSLVMLGVGAFLFVL